MQNYEKTVYAGILGKMIGVYAGRPVEGWTYDHIRERFDQIKTYVNDQVGMPLHVPDDDLSGTFAFLRCLEDFGPEAQAADFGETWLNYLIENRTVFWWGGMGRSTEHTAYLRLKAGISAPQSGSIATNGAAIAEQIGALIFIDGYAMICPNDPVRAMAYARQAASVSHDGLAVELACFWCALESLAFAERNLDTLLDRALAFPWSERLHRLVDDVRAYCRQEQDWRVVRDWLDEAYGYHLYPGNCHVVPNFALMLASVLLGGDSFSKALEIVISSGWDTDCNAGNICCFNAIRLGLEALDSHWRDPCHDRFYVISSLGCRCTADAATETARILAIHNRIYGMPQAKRQMRYSFHLPGSTQGFSHCPVVEGNETPARNVNAGDAAQNGLILMPHTALSVPVFYETKDRYGGYELIGSPTLYETQTVVCCLSCDDTASVRPYVVTCQGVKRGPVWTVSGTFRGTWTVPDLGGMPVERFGVERLDEDAASRVLLTGVDWQGAPKRLCIAGCLRREEDGSALRPFDAFTSSARQFQVDKVHTFCISHPAADGVADLGCEDWRDYRVSARVIPSLSTRCGLLARTHGHRKYYAAVLEDQHWLRLIARDGDKETVLASAPFDHPWDQPLTLSLECSGTHLRATADGCVLEAEDGRFAGGGAGMLVSEGSMLVDELKVEGSDEPCWNG
ncbi:MAG: ADP-ribosylglycohydrolase family protein [Clostridiales bacterium]|nr:ADP-ribosylglycohydrolase family protein [Clostridiales bacterium]